MSKSDQHVDNKRYSVIPRVLVLVFKDDQILLIKGANEKRIWAGKYNGIGGHVERGESIMQAAKRELKEETGLSLTDMWLSAIISVDIEKDKGVHLFVFKAINPGGRIKASKEGDIEWVKIGMISSLPVVEDLPILVNFVTKHEKGSPILFGQSHYDEKQRLSTNFIS